MLGATDLIELGRPRSFAASQPFLASRRPALGDALSSAGIFLADAIATVVGVIADIVAVPTEILVSGADVVFSNVSAVLREIPLLGDLAAQAMLTAGAILKFAIQVPHLALEKISNLFEGLSEALEKTFGSADRDKTVADARKRIVENAPPQARDQVSRMLPADRNDVRDATGVETGTGLSDALKLGLPIAAAGVVTVALLA
jgi:hypothetical protein